MTAQQPMTSRLYIGLMSGTSTDGVDAVLARFGDESASIELLGHHHLAFDAGLRGSLLSLNKTGPDELHRAALATNQLCASYAQAVQSLLLNCGVSRTEITAIGAHGQTVRHRPGEFDQIGYTLQLFNGALLAELTGLNVVCDFRTRDVAAGGQGAPLVPTFHQAMFGRTGQAIAVLNLGGIANLTLLGASGEVSGFDCGPGNALLDLWIQRHLGLDFDHNGAWSASGTTNPALLAQLHRDPFFARLPPKSTGRDLFNAAWLDKVLAQEGIEQPIATVDVQATLAQLTADTVASALSASRFHPDILLVCGGGALNTDLCRRIADGLPSAHVQSTELAGLQPMQVEAAAFAWLADRFWQRRHGNCTTVTGARGERILGCLYPA